MELNQGEFICIEKYLVLVGVCLSISQKGQIRTSQSILLKDLYVVSLLIDLILVILQYMLVEVSRLMSGHMRIAIPPPCLPSVLGLCISR